MSTRPESAGLAGARDGGWVRLARSADLDGVPRAVEAAGRRYVAYRPVPDELVVVAARCPPDSST